MPHNTFFAPEPFQIGKELSLSSEESKHLSVMRLQKDDECFLLNGSGEKARGKIQNLDQKVARVLIEEVEKKQPPHPPFHIILAITKFSKLEMAIEKICELGVSSITLFPADFSDIKVISENKRNRLGNILVSAIKQSDNFFLPTLTIQPSLQEIPLQEEKSYYGSLDEKASPFPALTESTSFFVGPEKGFSDKELKYFNEHRIEPKRIASTILRAETAAIAVASLAAYFSLSPPE